MADKFALAGTVMAGLLLASFSRSESILAVDVVGDSGDFVVDGEYNMLVQAAPRYSLLQFQIDNKSSQVDVGAYVILNIISFSSTSC